MSCVQKQLVDFDRFTLDVSEHLLWRGEAPIVLSRHAVAALECLIQNRGRWIAKEDLKKTVWPDTAVADTSVYRQISDLRHALGNTGERPQFIEVKHRHGYRFIAPVTERTKVTSTPALENHVTVAEDITPANAIPAAVPAPHTASRISALQTFGYRFTRSSRIAILLALCITAVLIYQAATPREARAIEPEQLTNDGNKKDGPLLTDGRRIFFVEQSTPAISKVFTTPVSGGEAAPLELPVKNPTLEAISSDRSTLLLKSQDGNASKLWAYDIATTDLVPLGTGFSFAAWIPGGRTLVAATSDGSSLLIRSGSGQRRIDLPAPTTSYSRLEWSPDGRRVRFSLLNSKRERSDEWELDKSNSRLRLLSLGRPPGTDVTGGTWAPNGKYFVYSAGVPWSHDLWIVRETSHGPQEPARLSRGEPGSWEWPAFSADGSRIFVLNSRGRSELVRFDGSTGSWQPEWDGAPAYELNYSRDCRWVAYTHFPDHTIWKARVNGAESSQLTNQGIEAHQPHWSPDGTRIAFMGKNGSGQWRIFQVSARGGTAEEVLPAGEEQGVPTWSPDGKYLVFGDLLGRKPKSEMSIHVLDLAHRSLGELAGSKGLWSPRWSPDGRHIAAITSDSQAIRILAWRGTHWEEPVRMLFVDNATWSIDSRFVYFNGISNPAQARLYRFDAVGGRLECLADLTDFPDTGENWFGVAPDGSPLAFRGNTRDEIFALKLVLP